MAEIVDKAILQDDEYLKSLKRIEKGIDNMTRQAHRGFDDTAKAAKVSGVQIGAITGIVTSLVTEIINLGKQAAQVFAEIAAESVSLAAKFEVNKGLIANIFEGDEEAANAVIDRLTKRGAEIGLLPGVAVGLGTSFLPDVGSLEQLDQFIEGAVKLKALAPEKTFEDIRQALEQALSGDPRAFADRLNLPLETIKRVKDLQAEFGKTDGLLMALDELFTKFGVNLEDISNTAIGKFSEIQAKLQELQLAGGEQALEAIKPLLDELITFLETNREELILFAASIGNAVGSIAEFVSELSGLSEIEPGQITQFGQDIFKLVEQLQLGIEIVGGWIGAVGRLLIVLDPINALLEVAGINLGDFFNELGNGQGAFVGFIDLIAQSKAGLEGIISVLQSVVEAARLTGESIAALASGDLQKASELAAQSNQAIFDSLSKAQGAANASYAESKAAIDEYTQSVNEQADSQEKLKDSLSQTNEAGTTAAETFLQQQQATKDAAKAAEELAEAQAKVNKAFAEAEKDFQRKLEDIDIQAERKRFDIALEFAQKREDAAEDNLEKLVDIRRKNQQDITDAATDLERKEEDIARKFADERIDLETDQRQKRVDIEKSFREKLQQIERDSVFDLDEASRKRDAVAYLRILRQRNEQVTQAQTDRQKEIDELRVTGERRKEELRVQQQRELEEASIANERKLEDLRLNLERQIEEQNIAYARQLDDIATNEQRKLDEANRARERDIEDAKRAYDRKLEDLRISLAEELAILAAGNAALEAEAARHAQAMAAAGQSNRTSSPRNQPEEDSPNSRPGFQNRQRQQQPTTRTGQQNQRRQRQTGGRRQFGGLVNAGGSYPVGENGPELFQPSGNGRIVPNSALVMPSMVPKSSINNVSNSRSQEINIPMVNGQQILDPIFIAQLRNLVLSELNRVL